MIRLFGNTIKETVTALKKSTTVLGESDDKLLSLQDKNKVWIRLVISIILIFVGTYLVTLPNGSETQLNTGVSILSLITGYWLK